MLFNFESSKLYITSTVITYITITLKSLSDECSLKMNYVNVLTCIDGQMEKMTTFISFINISPRKVELFKDVEYVV